jgi:hypothetical protein
MEKVKHKIDRERKGTEGNRKTLTFGQGKERIPGSAEGEERVSVGDLLGVVLLKLDLVLLSRSSVNQVEANQDTSDDCRRGGKSVGREVSLVCLIVME